MLNIRGSWKQVEQIGEAKFVPEAKSDRYLREFRLKQNEGRDMQKGEVPHWKVAATIWALENEKSGTAAPKKI